MRIARVRQEADVTGFGGFQSFRAKDFNLRVAFQRAAKPRGQFSEFHIRSPLHEDALLYNITARLAL
jgi:hypothetical protein